MTDRALVCQQDMRLTEVVQHADAEYTIQLVVYIALLTLCLLERFSCDASHIEAFSADPLGRATQQSHASCGVPVTLMSAW